MQLQLITLTISLFVAFAKADYQLVFADEFNGNQLNQSNWKFITGCTGFGNNELECYTGQRNGENARVENGNLVIEVRIEEFDGMHYTSTKLNSVQSWGHGKFEIRARLPSGKSLWPAFWMMPQSEKYGMWASSGEIDILELRGDLPSIIQGTIHYGGDWPNNAYSGSGEKTFPTDFSETFHTFGMEWTKDKIIWSLDGQQYHEENIARPMWSNKGINPYTQNSQPFEGNPFYLIMNVAVGGNFFNALGPWVTPVEARSWKKRTMEVDFVRVYQMK